MAYQLLERSFVAMVLFFSEGDLADTFIFARPRTATGRWPSPPLIFPFQELQYIHIHVALAPRFADQLLKEIKIDTESERRWKFVSIGKALFSHMLTTWRRIDRTMTRWRKFQLSFGGSFC
jgi:hypothetical protein